MRLKLPVEGGCAVSAPLPEPGVQPQRAFLTSFFIAIAVYFAFAIALAAVSRGANALSPYSQILDYRVAACAERVVLDHADPYRTGALRACEHARAREAGEPDWSVTPFALPPYAAVLLAPLAALDFESGRVVWLLLQISALGIIVAAMAGIVRRSALGVALVLIPTLGLINVKYGETILLAAAAVALAAFALQQRRYRLAAAAACFSMIDPSVGLPAALGLFILVPQTRVILVAGAIVFAALGLTVLGPAVTLEYISAFIPAHAHSEIFARDQYSLTRLAFVAGVEPKLAATLGSVCYVITIALGIVIARLVAPQKAMPSLYVLLPLAFSMFGGPFVHDDEIVTAVLAALVLAQHSIAARIAVALLSIGWGERWQHELLPAVAAASGVALLYLNNVTLVRRAGYVAVVSLCLVALNAVLPKSPAREAEVAGAPQPAISAADVSSLPWEWRIRLTPDATVPDPANELQKVPFWLALLIIPVACAGRRRTQQFVTRLRPHEAV